MIGLKRLNAIVTGLMLRNVLRGDGRQLTRCWDVSSMRAHVMAQLAGGLEQAIHHTDHALVGAMMARSWGVSANLCLAICLHHDYAIFLDIKVPDVVNLLIAMGLVSEVAIQRFARLNVGTEWNEGGEFASGKLALSNQDVDDWIERLLGDFAGGLS